MTTPPRHSVVADFGRLMEYIEDFGRLSGGAMRLKYGDDPMDGYNNVIRRARACYRRTAHALAARPAEAGEPSNLRISASPGYVAAPSGAQGDGAVRVRLAVILGDWRDELIREFSGQRPTVLATPAQEIADRIMALLLATPASTRETAEGGE